MFDPPKNLNILIRELLFGVNTQYEFVAIVADGTEELDNLVEEAELNTTPTFEVYVGWFAAVDCIKSY